MGSAPLFTGAAAPLSENSFDANVRYLEVEVPALWAVLAVETRGCGFFADRRPKLLFERHVFRSLTGGRFDAAHPELSHPERGGYTRGPGEYLRLERALALDAPAALGAASWGLGQVMGYHWKRLGYASPAALVRSMTQSEGEQLCAQALFIRSGRLDTALRTRNWARFARGYNGPDYRANQYDEKLEEAFRRFSTQGTPDLAVREGQVLLGFLGFEPGEVDGDFGPRTKAATARFQARHLLPTTGQLDEQTLASLHSRCAELPRNEAAPAGLEGVAHE